jgi:hypothetical protein
MASGSNNSKYMTRAGIYVDSLGYDEFSISEFIFLFIIGFISSESASYHVYDITFFKFYYFFFNWFMQ